jgi:hypothetical protein
MKTETIIQIGDKHYRAYVKEILPFYDITKTGMLEYNDSGNVDMNQCPPITEQVYLKVFEQIELHLPEYAREIGDDIINLDYFSEKYLTLEDLGIENYSYLDDFNIDIERIELEQVVEDIEAR